ncbi:hypothetical protein AMJ39_01470 [candidate division TA06 bacterium DG_24]|uniref:DUF4340 domain-containing protein n=3 Tax=Bacteria division TA06 TaxID=1156500 RepID=A0A0S8JNX7_UNCT6|nr:MAG: hypothetical protein AMJ39_01470 [candidate division TA06 bacterium DG_24]KPK71211.1 MAG: hypothetical protein AMJ82_01430 [candidate division TA06 bacterium SM23_40]KPL11460.1 MAG: hypothetical protein AMJ71_00655 [candidate division TA06 bacterium SM1_40]
MKRRQFRPLLFALAALILLFLVSEGVLRLGRREPRSTTLFPDFDGSRVEAISIARRATSVRLTRAATGWRVHSDTMSYGADPDIVDRLITALADMEGSLVSHNPANHAVFEVDSVNGTSAAVLDAAGLPLASLVIGKTAPSMAGTYLRRADEPEVYLTDSFLRSIFSPNLRTWRNRKILSFEPSELRSIELESPTESIRLERTDADTPWQMTHPEECLADAATVDGMTRILSHLTASDFAPDTLSPENAGLTPPQYRIMIELASGESREVLAGGDPEAVRLNVQISGEKTTYILPRVSIEMVMKGPEELKAEIEDPVAPESVETK